MGVFSIGRRTTNTTDTQCPFDVACSSALKAKLMEMGISVGTAAASVFGLNRPSAIGTRTTPVAILTEEDPDHPAITDVDTAIAHSAQPTFAAQHHRRIGLPATVGQGVVWTFPKGMGIDASGSVALQNIGTTGLVDVYVVVDR